eukprot:5789156-Pyramimonas_sp.AAC.1
MEFVRRFSDRHPTVRLAMLAWAHAYLMVQSGEGQAADVSSQICAAVHKLVLDFDERVRLNACATLCQVAVATTGVVPVDYLQVRSLLFPTGGRVVRCPPHDSCDGSATPTRRQG